MSKTHLYRHYDADGVLLYVGISLSALQRLTQHRDVSHWFDSIAMVKIQHFESRIEAREAEAEAIKREMPLHNIRHAFRVELTDEQIDKVLNDGKKSPAWYKYSDVAQMFGIREGDVKRAVELGQIEAIKFGNRKFITKEHLDLFLSSKRGVEQ